MTQGLMHCCKCYDYDDDVPRWSLPHLCYALHDKSCKRIDCVKVLNFHKVQVKEFCKIIDIEWGGLVEQSIRQARKRGEQTDSQAANRSVREITLSSTGTIIWLVAWHDHRHRHARHGMW